MIPEEANAAGIYCRDVEVGIQVENRGSSCGLRFIEYWVVKGEEETRREILYGPEEESPEPAEPQNFFSRRITVNARENNDSNVTLYVRAENHAGDAAEAHINLNIDVTAPVITVQYDNNAGDVSYGEHVYFDAPRVATITIQEKDFRKEAVRLHVTSTTGEIPTLSDWRTVGTGDETLHIATMTFDRDGDYTFSIEYVDPAQNAAAVRYINSLAPTAFSIDCTQPVVEMIYDNTAAENRIYYGEERLLTLRVIERNFDPNRVQITGQAVGSGAVAELPSISEWSGSGDVHTAVIRFAEDAQYTFTVNCLDRAGNRAEMSPSQVFYIDRSLPVLELLNMEDRSANTGREPIGLTLRAEDDNFEALQVSLQAVVREGDGFVKKDIDKGEFHTLQNGTEYIIENLVRDGIYELRGTASDKAGNITEAVYTFSVNREGSAFEMDEDTLRLAGSGLHYVKGVYHDVVVYEVNADSLENSAIILNGKMLLEGEVYERTLEERGKEAWYRYKYVIKASLFQNEDGSFADGDYDIVIYSRDRADNEAYSDIKSCKIHFVVDTRAPDVAVVSGMSRGGRYKTGKQTVTIRPTDDGGQLESLTVKIMDRHGNVTDTPLCLAGEELLHMLEEKSGNLTFDIGEGLHQQVRIICTDSSEDEQGEPNVYDVTYTDISVCPDALRIFLAGEPHISWVTGGCVMTLMGGITLFLFRRRRKKT